MPGRTGLKDYAPLHSGEHRPAGRSLPPDNEIAVQVYHRPQVYQTCGVWAELSRGRGLSALFSGPSRTGKTMTAKILAHNLKLDLYPIDLVGVVSKYLGETERNLAVAVRRC